MSSTYIFRLREALRGEDKILEDCQGVLTLYLQPGGLSAEETITRLLGLCDGPSQRAAQEAARKLLEMP